MRVAGIRAVVTLAIGACVLLPGQVELASAATSEWIHGYTAAHLSADNTRDLDGDGRGDVIVIREVSSRSGIDRTISVRRGHNGVRLWRVVVHSDHEDDRVAISALRLGKPARPAVLIRSSSDGDATLTAYDGHDGTVLWRRTLADPAYKDFGGTLPLLGGGYLPLPSVDLHATRILAVDHEGRPVVLSGVDGRPRDLGPANARRTQWYAAASLGNIDRDGHGDLGLAYPRSVRAISSSTGQVLWHSSVPAVEPRSVRDLEGRGSADLDQDGVPEVVASVAGFVRGAARDWVVLAGATGLLLYRVTHVTALMRAGDIDGDGRPDLLQTYRSGENEDGAGDDAPSTFSETLTARLSPRGSVAWQRTFSVSDSTATHDASPLAAGRVNADKATDVLVRLPEAGNPDYPVVSGRTGKVLSRDPRRVSPLQAQVGGTSGADLMRIRRSERDDLTVFDGRSREPVFRVTLPGLLNAAHVNSDRLTKDEHADLLVVAGYSSGSVVHVVGGATGRVRWSLSS